MSLSVIWTGTLKADNVDLGFTYNVDRLQGEKIVTCFEERAACMDKIKKMPQDDHSETVLYTIAGFVIGIVVGASVNH